MTEASLARSLASSGALPRGLVDPKMFAGNAAATAGNVVGSRGLVRMGVVAHRLDGTFFAFLAMGLYVLLFAAFLVPPVGRMIHAAASACVCPRKRVSSGLAHERYLAHHALSTPLGVVTATGRAS